MKRVDLTSLSIFDTLLDFTVEGENIDLHNNFLCTKVENDPFRRYTLFHFESPNRYFRLVFSEAKIYHFHFDTFQPITEKGFCFESLSRIKALTDGDGNSLDLPENSNYYEVTFYEDISFVIQAGRVVLQESSRTDLEYMRLSDQQVSSLSSEIAKLKMKLADLENRSGADTKTFLNLRKENKEQLTSLEGELEQKQEQLAKLREQDRLLLTGGFVQ